MVKPKYVCPVCNFKGLYEPAYEPRNSEQEAIIKNLPEVYEPTYELYNVGELSQSDDICPCCGFQFGLDDYESNCESYKEAFKKWRDKWIESNYEWFSENNKHLRPKEWNPKKQLKELEKKGE